jgi:hypothetical protein
MGTRFVIPEGGGILFATSRGSVANAIRFHIMDTNHDSVGMARILRRRPLQVAHVGRTTTI